MVTLELAGITAHYGRNEILTDATTPSIQGGSLTALVGPNAAGKSTLFRRIAGQMRGAGTVRLTGATQDDLRYMPQDTAMTAALSVYESIILALKQGNGGWRLSNSELAAVDGVLSRFGIASLADRQLPELSGGQRQVVSIAQTLVARPKLVLMDEPTSALDLYRQYEVLEALRLYAEENGAVMVLALHDLNQVMRCCTTTMALSQGRILACGATLDVLQPDLIRRLYGIDSRVERCSKGNPMMIVDGPAASAA
ncbi:ABC-type cobalamin/Fe3+-siderophores transport system, ATPase component [Hoeflea phototrophica DFL-43]|jgi:iron complex transport system ATP-binding protein|uniref:ABC-type cobalamin/Fe3+-siderophores transport system, ATPase component n=1 Tax=Hoeflea phototrophica (strain DSM 17068 / NCIMB 14078 / DFL-43) TaxID=411684 RepID=A9DEU7_HOEPD|nr:ABC transporter ATP-binding protein [Hoeflea phototrophica]EDQ31846.1 ABC-type cobalamin/Fe3+-siderophores transport system, ATPase component [Hoeflea phototrophica DFL-43]